MTDRIRVLHVDDQPDFADMAATFLERADDQLTVETATSAAAGLDRLETETIHCVVSDYDMPRTNGVEFLEQVRERHGDLPFILFTGKGSEEVASEAISAGVTEYLQKESGTDQFAVLANRIANTVQGARATRQLDVLIDNLPGIIYQHRDEPEWPLTLIRGNCEELMGYTEQELQSDVHLAEQAIHPDDREYHNRTLRDELAATGSYELTYRVLHKNGDVRWVLDSGQKHDSPIREGELFSGILIDITELKRHEQELESTRQRLEAILENTTTPMFLKDADGEYLLVNSGYRELFDLGEETVVGRTDEELHGDDVAAEFGRTDRTVIEQGDPVEAEERVAVDGEERIFSMSKVPVYDVGTESDPETPVAVFGVATDITDHVRQKQRLRRQNERLDELAGVLSHDLQTPIATARGRLEIALETGDVSHVETARSALDRIDNLRTELASVMRRGQIVGETEPVDLADAAETVWTSLDPPPTAALETDDETIRGDPNAVARLLENLLNNAVEHGGEDVTVRVERHDDGFAVVDDGPGLDLEDPQQAFEAGVSTKDGDGPHGMGLVSVRQIVLAHGWDAHVTDGEQGGLRVVIEGVRTG
jgi:PAS domain S-box-containing protein